MTPNLIFDLDGTLVDSLPGIAASLNCALSSHQLATHSQAVVRSFIGNGVKVLVERAAPSDASTELIHSVVESFKSDYQLSWQDGTKAYSSISNILKEFQQEGYQMAVLSNKTHAFTQTITRELFPLIHFTLILGQQEGSPHKPHPAGAFKIANAMGTTPQHCVLIGDSITDLETAANAGMPSIAVTWGYYDRDRLKSAGPTKIADSPSQLPQLLKDFENW